MWQLDARTLWECDATVASEQTAEFVFRVLGFRVDQRYQTHGAKLWNRHGKIMVHYGTSLQDACALRNSN